MVRYVSLYDDGLSRAVSACFQINVINESSALIVNSSGFRDGGFVSVGFKCCE